MPRNNLQRVQNAAAACKIPLDMASSCSINPRHQRSATMHLSQTSPNAGLRAKDLVRRRPVPYWSPCPAAPPDQSWPRVLAATRWAWSSRQMNARSSACASLHAVSGGAGWGRLGVSMARWMVLPSKGIPHQAAGEGNRGAVAFFMALCAWPHSSKHAQHQSLAQTALSHTASLPSCRRQVPVVLPPCKLTPSALARQLCRSGMSLETCRLHRTLPWSQILLECRCFAEERMMK